MDKIANGMALSSIEYAVDHPGTRLIVVLGHYPYYRRWGSWIKACEALLEFESAGKEVSIEIPEKNNEALKEFSKRKRPIPLRIRYAILLRDRFTCQICGKSPPTTPGLVVDVDHIIPESYGGTLDPLNLRCLCRECNLGKGSFNEL